MKKILLILLMAVALAAGCGAEVENRQENTENKELLNQRGQSDLVQESEIFTVDNDEEDEDEGGYLEVHFIDVEQGDAILMKCDGQTMLIDAGNSNMGTKVQLYLKKQNVDVLKYIVASHPDADHVGGLDVIVSKFDVLSGEIWMTDDENDTEAYKDLVEAIDYKSLNRRCPEAGETYQLGNASITILGPIHSYEDNNDNSIVIKVQKGNNTFLFMGDATENEENDLCVNYGDGLQADVLKIGHHGSRYSTGNSFLDLVNPEYAVILVGEGNDYGHPTEECLNKLKTANVKVFRTDEQRSVVAVADGENIWWNRTASDTWKVGEIADNQETNNSDKLKIADDVTYVLNTNTLKFHKPTCDSVTEMKAKNREFFYGTRDEAIDMGYVPCKSCRP